MRLRLADEHPVEGIAVQRGQIAQLRDGSFIQNQGGDEMFLALLADELGRRLGQRKFAQTVFDGDLAKRNRAQKNLLLESRIAAETVADNFGSPDTSRRNSQASSKIFICLQRTARDLPAAGR